MLPRNHPDRIRIAFDDHRLVTNAGLLLPATLALHLGLPQAEPTPATRSRIGPTPMTSPTPNTWWPTFSPPLTQQRGR